MSEMLSPADLSEEMKVPLQTVYAWNHHGTGPRPIKVGRHVRYRREDVDAWLADHSDDRTAA